MHFLKTGRFELENGKSIPELDIAYHTYGALNSGRDNVIWICHALTANSDVLSWWPGLVGEGCAIDPKKHFIVCANIVGSCYGTTGPLSRNPDTGQSYFHDFPAITIRDMVMAHMRLAAHLNLRSIEILLGGSMGGYQVLEWAAMQPGFIRKMMLVATSARESAWGIAIHTAQRLAIEADSTWKEKRDDAGSRGLKAARGFAMLTYRSYQTYLHTQEDTDTGKTDGFRASSYIEYQGEKLVRRFNAFSYWLLSKAMDSHNLARGRNPDLSKVLASLSQPALVIGIQSDLLCPPAELEFIAKHLPQATYHCIDSLYGHDGFLTEARVIGSLLQNWRKA